MFLNFDVLERLFEYLYVNHHIISFMMTCRTLYDAGIPHVLDIVELRDGGSVYSFSRFMLVDPSRRCRHLKHLIVDGTSGLWLPHVKEMFVKFLRHAQSLAHLDIVCCQTLFSQDPRIAPLVSSLRHLRVLELKVLNHEHLWVVQALEAGLTDLTLTFTPRSLTQDAIDPTPYLSNVSQSLQKLRVGNCWFNTSSGELRFPRVRILEFESTHTRTIDVAPMVLSFPNLRCLYIQHAFGRAPNLDFDASRARNLAAPSWRSLDEVVSDILTLFVLGLHCPITRLTLLPFGRHQLDQFSVIMDSTQPMEFNLDHLADVFREDADSISQAFRHPLSFARLVWRIDFGRLSLDNRGTLKFAKAKKKLLAIIETSAIKSLTLCISFASTFRATLEYVPQLSSFPETEFRRIDKAKLAEEIFEASPSLEFLEIRITTHSPQWWVKPSDRNSAVEVEREVWLASQPTLWLSAL